MTSMWRTSGWILVGSALILALSLGVRHGFGLFLAPMSSEFGWGRETFAFAIALQNLIWGLAQPFTGALADRFGAKARAICGQALLDQNFPMIHAVGRGSSRAPQSARPTEKHREKIGFRSFTPPFDPPSIHPSRQSWSGQTTMPFAGSHA